jgi:urease accessory protein
MKSMSDPKSPSAAVRERDYAAGLYRLLAWLSPGFPIGAFSFSHGLEAEFEKRIVNDRRSLQHWIAAVVVAGSGRIDADILGDAYRAAASDNVEELVDANHRGVAFRATAETALEATEQGRAFLNTCVAAWPDPFLDRWAARLDGVGVCYAAAFGAATARAGIPLRCALTGYLQAMAANLVSAGLRLGIIGHTDGQRLLYALEAVIEAAVESAVTRDRDSFGSMTFAVDVASMTHETQYTRLFRS